MNEPSKKALARREYRAKNPEKVAESKRRSAKKNAAKIAAYQKAYREKHREKLLANGREYSRTHKAKKRTPEQNARYKPYVRELHLKKKYGIDENGYQSLLASQGGCCAICKTTDPHGRRHNRFHVDHCHKSKAVRGLLCSRCNMGIGSFLDDVELMKKAIDYLVKSKANGNE